MRSLAKLSQCFIALFLVIQILRTTNAAPLDAQNAQTVKSAPGVARNIGNNENENFIGSFRQASEGDSYEDSDEDDGEDDAEQAQQSLIEQQNQQRLEESQEGSEEEDGSDDAVDDVRHRRRRDVAEMPAEAEVKPSEETTTVEKETSLTEPTPAASQPAATTEESLTSPSLNRTSVLILIRDALQKVTTVLPTETVATNALQYFQLFQHFIQQTIEQVIEDYDEEEEEAATTVINLINDGGEALPEKQETNENSNVDQTKEPVTETGTDENKLELPPVPETQQQTHEMPVTEPVKEAEGNAEKTATT